MALQRQNDRTVVGGIGLIIDEGAPQHRGCSQARLEVSSQHGSRREARCCRIRGSLNSILPTQEEKQLVFLDGSSKHAAKLIALQVIPDIGDATAVVSAVCGIKHVVPDVLECVAVKLVRARFRNHVDRARWMRAILGGQRAGFYLELLDRVGERKRKILIAQRVVVRAAIEPVGNAALRAAGNRGNCGRWIRSAKRAALRDGARDLSAFCHWNANIDNAWYWHDENGALACFQARTGKPSSRLAARTRKE